MSRDGTLTVATWGFALSQGQVSDKRFPPKVWRHQGASRCGSMVSAPGQAIQRGHTPFNPPGPHPRHYSCRGLLGTPTCRHKRIYLSQQGIHPLSPTGPDTRTYTLARTHMTENLQVSVALHTALVLHSQSLGTPGLCPAVHPPPRPLLGLPQGTQYPRAPLHPPPQQEKGLRELLRPTSTCSISRCLLAPGTRHVWK